jgi:hypothetical protein
MLEPRLGRPVHLLLTPVREAIRQRVGMFPTADVRVERSALGDNAGLMGGLALAGQRTNCCT